MIARDVLIDLSDIFDYVDSNITIKEKEDKQAYDNQVYSLLLEKKEVISKMAAYLRETPMYTNSFSQVGDFKLHIEKIRATKQERILVVLNHLLLKIGKTDNSIFILGTIALVIPALDEFIKEA